MDVRRLTYLVAVVDHGSMTKAASACYVSQPALSKAIRELEHELGTPLFHRVGRRVVSTPACDALLPHARRVLRDVRAAGDAVASVLALEDGHLDLACLPTLAAHPTAGLIGRFRADHPRVSVRLASPEDPADLAGMVGTGEVELGISDSSHHGTLTAIPLGREELVFILPPGSPGPAIRSIPQLAELMIVASPSTTSNRQKLNDAFADADLEPRVVVETAQRDAIVPLVLAGAGAALVPQGTAATAGLSGAVVVRVRPTITRAVVCLHRSGPLSPGAERFLASAAT